MQKPRCGALYAGKERMATAQEGYQRRISLRTKPPLRMQAADILLVTMFHIEKSGYRAAGTCQEAILDDED